MMATMISAVANGGELPRPRTRRGTPVELRGRDEAQHQGQIGTPRVALLDEVHHVGQDAMKVASAGDAAVRLGPVSVQADAQAAQR